jgi:tetratricopeptide (TPR) repeat protein
MTPQSLNTGENQQILLTRAMEQTVATDLAGYQALCRLCLGKALMLADSLGEAQALAKSALALARQHDERGHQAYTLRLLGDIAIHRHPPEFEQAETHYQQALTLADELSMRPLQAHCHLGLGTLYSQMRRAERAQKELSTAIEMYRDMEMTFWLPETETALTGVQGKV